MGFISRVLNNFGGYFRIGALGRALKVATILCYSPNLAPQSENPYMALEGLIGSYRALKGLIGLLAYSS